MHHNYTSSIIFPIILFHHLTTNVLRKFRNLKINSWTPYEGILDTAKPRKPRSLPFVPSFQLQALLLCWWRSRHRSGALGRWRSPASTITVLCDPRQGLVQILIGTMLLQLRFIQVEQVHILFLNCWGGQNSPINSCSLPSWIPPFWSWLSHPNSFKQKCAMANSLDIFPKF